MDMITSGFYLFDYFYNLSVNGLIRILEIQNADEIRPILEMISLSTRSLPPMIMFAAVSKVGFLILNVFLVFAFSPAAWQVCTENSNVVEVIKTIERKEKKKSKSKPKPKSPTVPTVARRVHHVNVVVAPANEKTEEEVDVPEQPVEQRKEKNAIELNQQPAFNPYISQRRHDTRF
jgi:hypothetical protein